jgi:hypothetical protein
MTRIQIPLVLVGLTAAVLFAAPAAEAEMMKFKADLKGAAEVPPADSAATGNAEVTVDTDAKKISWTVKVDGLSGEATAAHFHGPASATESAPPVIDMSSAIMDGSGDITDAQWAELQAGKYYVNVHTAKFPDGEIRGQLEAAK